MADNTVHVGDIGTELFFLLKDGSVELDPDTATRLVLFIYQKKKTPPVTEITPTTAVDPDDNKKKVYWKSTDGMWSVAGKYQAQVYAEFGDPDHFHTSIYEFEVASNLQDAPST